MRDRPVGDDGGNSVGRTLRAAGFCGRGRFMKIFSFVAAASNSGKTTLIEKVVPLLRERGLRVAVIKHASKGFELDRPGKDSWRFREAGADAVLLAGPGRTALLRNAEGEPKLDELLGMLPDVDIVLVEGFKRDAVNRIEVFRSGVSGVRPLCADDGSFLALVSDRRFDAGIPWFDLNDAQGLAEFLQSGR
jgi:molybdopterin-guanine dinucleotide biosynthesis protein B